MKLAFKLFAGLLVGLLVAFAIFAGYGLAVSRAKCNR